MARDIQEVKKPYVQAYGVGTVLQIPSVQDTIILKPDSTGPISILYSFGEVSITITDPNSVVTTIATTQNQSGTFTLSMSGSYTIRYFGQTRQTVTGGTSPNPEDFLYIYRIEAVENKYPLKKQTVKEVVERILELIEPLTWDRTSGSYVKPPRFRFGYKYAEGTADGESERKLFNRIAPEFTFTRMTLRECLQEVGKFIHAEPRLHKGVIFFDRYGEQDKATFVRVGDRAVTPFSLHPYKGKRLLYNVNTACTSIESQADNFVDRLDETGGTVAEPYLNGALTLRSDTAYARFEDSEGAMYFPTHEPVMDVTSFVWVDVAGLAGTAGARYDITPYIFEKTIYDAQLSSYSAQYPTSKCYGLYFTQGQSGIYGFFFKNEEWSGGIYADYAIQNILKAVTGKELDLSEKYPELCFELVYTPIYGARLAHGKSYTGDMLKKPFSLMYNQSANVIETRYYGEHVKAVAERLGNVEKTVDIVIHNVGNMPRIGQMWDDEYYIATVSACATRDNIGLSIGLSKKFNRLSEYVGANSYKRYYEVSERMSQDRRTLYRDYLLITDKTGGEISSDCFFGAVALASVANTFYQSETAVSFGGTELVTEIVSCAEAQGFSANFTPMNKVLLPVISSAFGNVMEFMWSYKDNYSAGISSTYQEGTKVVNGKEVDVSGYFGLEATYGDVYGRMYYQRYALQSRGKDITLKQSLGLPYAFDGTAKTVIGMRENVYRIIRKDSRENLSQCYSCEFVTDIKDLVIGSALARNNPTVSGVHANGRAVLYVLQKRVNQFSNDDLDLSAENATAVMTYTVGEDGSGNISLVNGNYLSFQGAAAPVAGKAWAIVTSAYEGEPYTVENEYGETETVTPKYGGELLIAKNGDIAAGERIGKFNVVPMHDIFGK